MIEGAANHLLSRLPETDEHRWNVTQALGSIVAARKSLESAAESLLHIVAQDGADMLAVEVNGGEIVEKPQCPSRAVPVDVFAAMPTRCRLDAGHVGNHDDHEFRWSDDETDHPRPDSVSTFSVSQADLIGPELSVVDRMMAAQRDALRANPGQF